MASSDGVASISAPRRQADGTLIWDGIKIDVTEFRSGLRLATGCWSKCRKELRLDDRQEALQGVAELLGRHFDCARTGYAYLDASQEPFPTYDVCWTDGSAPPLLGESRSAPSA